MRRTHGVNVAARYPIDRAERLAYSSVHFPPAMKVLTMSRACWGLSSGTICPASKMRRKVSSPFSDERTSPSLSPHSLSSAALKASAPAQSSPSMVHALLPIQLQTKSTSPAY